MKKELPKFKILYFIYAFALLMTPFLANANYVNSGFLALNIVIAILSRKFLFSQRLEGKLYIAFFAFATVVTIYAPFYVGTSLYRIRTLFYHPIMYGVFWL